MTDRDESAAAEGRVTATRHGDILRLTIDRPDRRNSLSHTMIREMVSILTDAATDDSLRAVGITGAGGNFCTGADWVATNSSGQRPRTGDLVRRIPHGAHRLIELVTTLHLPVVCTVRGWAVGLGCNLALAADFTVASDGATFWEPFIARGFTPDSGASWLLPRLAGVARAKRMVLLGEQVSGTDAAAWGLIDSAVAETDLDSAADALLNRLAAGPTIAIGLAKQSIARAANQTLPEAMDAELATLELACRTADFKEGLAAFRERRAPDFQGR